MTVEAAYTERDKRSPRRQDISGCGNGGRAPELSVPGGTA